MSVPVDPHDKYTRLRSDPPMPPRVSCRYDVVYTASASYYGCPYPTVEATPPRRIPLHAYPSCSPELTYTRPWVLAHASAHRYRGVGVSACARPRSVLWIDMRPLSPPKAQAPRWYRATNCGRTAHKPHQTPRLARFVRKICLRQTRSPRRSGIV